MEDSTIIWLIRIHDDLVDILEEFVHPLVGNTPEGKKAIAQALQQIQQEIERAVIKELKDIKNVCVMEGVSVSGINRVVGTRTARLEALRKGKEDE